MLLLLYGTGREGDDWNILDREECFEFMFEVDTERCNDLHTCIRYTNALLEVDLSDEWLTAEHTY